MIWYPSHGATRNSQVSVRKPASAVAGMLPLMPCLACAQVRVLDHLQFMNSKTLFKARARVAAPAAPGALP